MTGGVKGASPLCATLATSLLAAAAWGNDPASSPHWTAPELPTAITFDGALALTTDGPRLVGSNRASSAKRAVDAQLSSALGNPQLAVQPGYRLAPSAARAQEWIIGLIQPWSLAGYGAARRAAANMEEQVLDARTRLLAVEQRLAAARAWIDLGEAQSLLATAKQQEVTAGELAELVARAAELGAATKADLADARALQSEARLVGLAAEGEVHDRGLMLARELGLATLHPLTASGPLPQPPGVAELAASPKSPGSNGGTAPVWVDVVTRLPAVRLAALQVRATKARAVEERALRSTSLLLGAGVQRDAPGGLVLSGIARLTLPVLERGERERATLRAQEELLRAERAAAAATAPVAIGMVLHEVAHTGEVATELANALVPASREAATLRRTICLGGEATIVELLLALSAASRLERARAAHAGAKVQAWLLVTSAVMGPVSS